MPLIPAGTLTIVPIPEPIDWTRSKGPAVPGLNVKLDVPTISAPPRPEVVLAVMVVVQLVDSHPVAVASPVELIVATSTSLDSQVTESVKSTVVGLVLKVPIAKNWAVSPSDATV